MHLKFNLAFHGQFTIKKHNEKLTKCERIQKNKARFLSPTMFLPDENIYKRYSSIQQTTL